MPRIPGSQVDELAAQTEEAARNAIALKEALAREREDAEQLEPKRRAAVSAHADACVAYEHSRDLAADAVARAADAIERLAESRVAISQARRQVDGLGATPELTTPGLLHRTEGAGHALERLRALVLTAI